MKRIQYCGLAIIMAGMWGTTLAGNAAENYLGAQGVLQKVKAKPDAPPVEEKKTSPAVALRKEIVAFGAKVQTMAPEAAAKEWLNYFDKLVKIKPQQGGEDDDEENGKAKPASIDDLYDALPSPAAWPDLEKAILARPPAKDKELLREQGLKLLAHTLNNNATARQSLMGELEKQAKTADQRQRYQYQSIFQYLRNAYLASIDDPKVIMQTLEQQLANTETSYGRSDLNVPNLVILVGEKEADDFLRRALTKSKLRLRIQAGDATQKLARKLALELVNDLQAPQWNLVNSLDSLDLYEAMEKKFAVKTNAAKPAVSIPGLPDMAMNQMREGNDYEKQQARQYYFLGLIAKKRHDDALKLAKEVGKQGNAYLPPEAISAMQKAGYSKALADFFYTLLKDDPALPYWHNYVQISANVGETDKMLELVRASVKRTDLPESKKGELANVLVSALLAADKVDEGVAELRRLMTKSTDDKDDDGEEESYGERGESAGLQLARIGLLLQKKEWIDEGLVIAKKKLAQEKKQSQRRRYSSGSEELELAALLMDLDRGAEAESVITSHLTKLANKKDEDSYGSDRAEVQALGMLASLYHKAGRYEDVITLFNQATYWQVADLKEIYLQSPGEDGFSHFHKKQKPLGYLLADSLIKQGQRDAAKPIVEALLIELPGIDRSYELLLALDASQAISKLDALYARDQFEERPLIWKGKLLLDAGKLEEAEAVIRKAVSIDPSDGEQGPDDRMRVYSVLADIREKRGDKKEAELFRGAVKAIRLSEQADKFAMAGLLKRAVQMYQDSLKHFADAYCIQSRLAVQLSEMGMHQEAEAYYQKAYELMPDSFGRVESHCFGCERAFAGDRAQSIAERVFSKLVAERPNKPQVHYLLGYLRFEQARFTEALPLFQKAVQLDPDYLNAWLKIQATMREARLARAEQDKVSLAILRLDPLSRHSGADLGSVNDLKALWAQVANNQAQRPKVPEKLYALAAAAKELEEKSKNENRQSRMMRRYSYSYSSNREQLTPGGAVSANRFIQAANLMLGVRSRSNGYSNYYFD